MTLILVIRRDETMECWSGGWVFVAGVVVFVRMGGGRMFLQDDGRSFTSSSGWKNLGMFSAELVEVDYTGQSFSALEVMRS